MRGKNVLLAGGLIIFLMFQSFKPDVKPEMTIPDEINEILKASCFGCHSTSARNEESKETLNFELWGDYRITKKIGLLEKIGTVIGEEKMPPEKFLEKRPERKLTKEQSDLIVKWSEEESDNLMKDE